METDKLVVEEVKGKYILGYYSNVGADEPYFMECEYVSEDYIITKQDYEEWLY